MSAQSEERPAPRLFISYSHDSPEHQDRVLDLANRLRRDGIDAILDQYNPAPAEGWPMWMDREIQHADFVALVCTETYLRRVEGCEEPGKGRGVLWESRIIYNILYQDDASRQRFIPLFFDEAIPAFVPLPIRGFTLFRVDTEEGYDRFYRLLTGQLADEKPALGRLRSLPAIEPNSYPASFAVKTRGSPTSIDIRNRQQMIRRVRSDWIEGVLHQSLYKVARLELGLESRMDAVEHPLRAIVQSPDRLPEILSSGSAISEVFDDHGGALLILGAPGTGKTTLLLELAEKLLDRAESDEFQPIPVIFNLSSWAVGRRPIGLWLIDELNKRNDVPKNVAQRWVETEQILPLLDGLDEVAAEHRRNCAEAINRFRRDHGLLPIAVCSRTADYEALGAKLRLRTAVIIQPLSRHDVQVYLEHIGDSSQPIRRALEKDPGLWELLDTPLTLWVALVAYHADPVKTSSGDNLEQRRYRLFASYVEAMFKRRSASHPYSKQRTLSYLSWLASALSYRKQTVFFLEDLTEQWLRAPFLRVLSKVGAVIGATIVGSTSGLVIGVLAGCLRIGWYYGDFGLIERIALASTVGLGTGTAIGFSVGLLGSITNPRAIEGGSFSIINLSSRLTKALRDGLVAGLIGGLVIELFLVLEKKLVGARGAVEIPHLKFYVMIRPQSGLLTGLAIAFAFALYSLLVSGEVVRSRRIPNQGTRRSLLAALTAGGIAGAVGGLGGRLLYGIGFGLMDGVSGALILASICGGLFAIRHWIVRLILSVSRSAPLNYVPFLNYAADRLFLRHVGGGYIFIHRMLLEYFASLSD